MLKHWRMPRSKSNWDNWFARREGGSSRSQKKKSSKASSFRTQVPTARVIGEYRGNHNSFTKSHIEKFADYRRANPTPAEAEFARFLIGLNEGVLKGQFVREHIISGKWIVDFFFPKIRLAVEIDGSIHLSGIQKKKDRLKDRDAARFDITVLRVTNSEVAGDKVILTNKLRAAWRTALQRENKIIGKLYD